MGLALIVVKMTIVNVCVDMVILTHLFQAVAAGLALVVVKCRNVIIVNCIMHNDSGTTHPVAAVVAAAIVVAL